MKLPGFLAPAIVLLAAPVAAHSPADDCDSHGISTAGELQRRLSEKAVEAVTLAASGVEDDVRLRKLVSPSATFYLGSGDVGRPLGLGIAGARALAREMKADTFRFLGWDYIPTPIDDACGPREVEVEFTDSRHKWVYPVTFSFQGGRIVAAKGWSRSFESGRLAPALSGNSDRGRRQTSRPANHL